MFKRKLCSKCKMGKYTYELDKRSPECPYIGRHRGNDCPMYVKLVKPKKADLEGIYSEIGKSNSLNRSFAICLCNIKKLRF